MLYDISFTQVHEIEGDFFYNHELNVTINADSEDEALDILYASRIVNSITGVYLSDSQSSPRFELLN
ncbi:hypothetical protein ABC382_00770 [Lysinibacillus sp. 1P01SD]|uniref:hypothetical protein n=1 Tax=Lysinibacillus sp. 1P01SD TaxID=3132285 RepID=UPI0039A1C8C9